MPVIANDSLRISNLVKFETKPELGFCRTVVTVNEASATNYVVGTVLGKVTASGKYKVAVETAVDGSKVAAGLVLATAAIPASTDTKIVVLTRGPAAISKGALVLDATYNDATKQGVVYTTLEASGIQVLEAA
jgi:Bacteriophage lambda head decoration protein D